MERFKAFVNIIIAPLFNSICQVISKVSKVLITFVSKRGLRKSGKRSIDEAKQCVEIVIENPDWIVLLKLNRILQENFLVLCGL